MRSVEQPENIRQVVEQFAPRWIRLDGSALLDHCDEQGAVGIAQPAEGEGDIFLNGRHSAGVQEVVIGELQRNDAAEQCIQQCIANRIRHAPDDLVADRRWQGGHQAEVKQKLFRIVVEVARSFGQKR